MCAGHTLYTKWRGTLCNSCTVCSLKFTQCMKIGHCLAVFCAHQLIIECAVCSVHCMGPPGCVLCPGFLCAVFLCTVCVRACAHSWCVLCPGFLCTVCSVRACARGLAVAGFTDSSSSGAATGTFVAGARRNSGSTKVYYPLSPRRN